MLILLPPSEGKTAPRRGAPVDLTTLSFPELTPTRERLLLHLVTLCRENPRAAEVALGLGPSQAAEVEVNACLRTSPTAPAIAVYSGVLFDALGYATLSSVAKRRANTRIAIASGLWGLLRPRDRIPCYRLSGGVSLSEVGTLASLWRQQVGAQIANSNGLIIDLRSTTYIALGAIPPSARRRAVTMRVLQQRNGRRTIVSHMNKATKGRILRAALESDSDPSSAADLMDGLRSWGFVAERDDNTINVIVAEL